jgi:uncharacterized membrane protein
MVPFYQNEEYSYFAGLILAFLIGALIISSLIVKTPALISLLIVVFGFSMIVFGITDLLSSIVFYFNDRLINSGSNLTRLTGPVLRILVGFLLFNNSKVVRSWIMKAINQENSNSQMN